MLLLGSMLSVYSFKFRKQNKSLVRVDGLALILAGFVTKKQPIKVVRANVVFSECFIQNLQGTGKPEAQVMEKFAWASGRLLL